ncbi:GrpB family protein [Marinobacter daepoensis]|uniref:GrpB family protein n=1 Tax=Marinobacter daepoensis TaxID=262077 RepID=A0ABS3BE49_9GAMM|nr:GrpB family protein [Marinobacter daepoensis]MBN7770027.1 GrpB family protein [Marinobacter daepoensis]MBY6080415.1 GrpB family protein [Marinobacter daepoensis]
MDEEESLNRAIYEEVAIFPYDKGWPLLFEEERDRLLHLFPGSFLAIEHIGSTAVPGLSAKPIIDILAGVDAMPRADALMEPLCQARYTTSMEFNASLAGRRWLMRWAEGRRTHHLHLVVYGSQEWQQRLAFRDRLRTNAEIAVHYEQNKRVWAAEFRSDREAYTAAKADFIRETLRSAT